LFGIIAETRALDI
jgi:hypothetical protein